MREAWRIVKAKHAATAFSGEGAAKTGGRWNSKGVPVVYCSGSQSLAALETLAHLNPLVSFAFVVYRIQFDDALLEKYPMGKLPSNWKAMPAAISSKSIGNAWARESRSPVLQVPSVIVPEEANYLLNPFHSDFKKLVIGKPTPFVFDQRLLPPY